MSKSPRKPGRQTQSKASKPELIPLDEHLAALLNPALNRERAEDAARAKAHEARARQDNAREGTAREGKLRSEGRGFGERQQAGYDPEDVENVDPELARKLGLPMSGTAKASEPEPLHPGNRKRDQGLTRADILNAAPKRVRQGNVLREEGEDAQVRGNGIVGASATMDSLKALLEAGDPNLREKSIWAPHRPARPTSPRAASSSSSSPSSSPPATSPPPSPSWWKACSATSATRCCSASPARARPSRWRRSSRAPIARR